MALALLLSRAVPRYPSLARGKASPLPAPIPPFSPQLVVAALVTPLRRPEFVNFTNETQTIRPAGLKGEGGARGAQT